MVSAVTALAIWLLCATNAHAYRFGATITQTGPEETVFDWSSQQCEPDSIPDLPARAFRDSSNNVHLLLQHWVTHQFVGPNLNSVTLNCNLLIGSQENADPAAYADREWIASPYTLDGWTVYALMHEEYLGRDHAGQCSEPANVYDVCRMMAVTSGISTSAGAGYYHATPPGQVVATIPYRYTPDVATYGYSVPSNIVKHYDGYYYALIKASGYQQQQAGACLMRTKKLADPTSWRAWNGTGFTVQFIDPYTSSADPAQHVCKPLDWIKGNTESLTFNTWLGQYLLVGTGSEYDASLGRDVYGFYYSTSTDLIHWSQRQLVMEAVLPWTYEGCGDASPVQYPSMLDPNSSSRNFETTGRTMYLYFVRDNYNQYCNQGMDRDLIRIPVAFPNETGTGPGYPRPKGATPMRIPLVPSYKPCTVRRSNMTHGQPLGYASCSPPIRPGYLTLGTPDANGNAANGNGSLTIRAIAGNSSTTADEADVRLGESIADVRRKSDLADYTGELQTTLTLRITDRYNADAPSRSAATTTDLPFSFTVPCTATSQTDRGSNCTLSTTADTLMPGAVPEGKRSIWDVRNIQVNDGGPDGRAATLNGNTVFERQGLFIP